MINKIVHSEIKHAALKLRERESSLILILESRLIPWTMIWTALNQNHRRWCPRRFGAMRPGKNNPKQPRNPKNGSGKRFRAYKIPFRKDIRIKNRQRGYLSQTSIWNPQVSNSSDWIPGKFPFRENRVNAKRLCTESRYNDKEQIRQYTHSRLSK